MDVLTVPTKSFPGLTRNKGQPAAASTASRAAGFSQRPLADRLRLTVRAQESCGRGRCLVGGADGGFGAGRVVGARPSTPPCSSTPQRLSVCVCGPGQDDRAWHVAGGSLARSWWVEAVGVEGPGPRPPVPTRHGLHTMGTGFFVPHYL